MPFCIQNKEPPECPEEIKKMSATEVCERTAMWASQAAAKIANSLAGASGPFGMLSSIVSSATDSMQDTLNQLEVKLNTKSMLEQDSRCRNKIIQLQDNIINAGNTPECLRVIATLPRELQLKILESGNISNVSQINVADATNICKLDLMLSVLSEMEANIDNTILQGVINTTKGILANASSQQTVCNDISTEMTACKYIHQTQCCSQEIEQKQNNLIDTRCGGSVINAIQSNTGSATNQCMLSASASISEKMKSVIKNVVTQTAENTSTGLTADFFIIIIIIFCLLFAGPFLMFKYMLSKIFYIVGGVFIVAGVICGIKYITSKKSGITKYNEPYSACVSFAALKPTLEKKTLGEAKNFVKNNDKVIGYEFFIDLPLDPDTREKVKPTDETARNATDETTGMVFWITRRPKEGANCTDDKESAVITYIKDESNPRFLIISILLFIVGIVCIGIGLFKDYRSSKPVVPLDKTEPLAKTAPLAKT